MNSNSILYLLARISTTDKEAKRLYAQGVTFPKYCYEK